MIRALCEIAAVLGLTYLAFWSLKKVWADVGQHRQTNVYEVMEE